MDVRAREYEPASGYVHVRYARRRRALFGGFGTVHHGGTSDGDQLLVGLQDRVDPLVRIDPPDTQAAVAQARLVRGGLVGGGVVR